jgi:hypothetical protein
MLAPLKILKKQEYKIPESEKEIERHLDAASEHHSKALFFLNEGEYEKAAQNALLAQKYLDFAGRARRESQERMVSVLRRVDK